MLAFRLTVHTAELLPEQSEAAHLLARAQPQGPGVRPERLCSRGGFRAEAGASTEARTFGLAAAGSGEVLVFG